MFNYDRLEEAIAKSGKKKSYLAGLIGRSSVIFTDWAKGKSVPKREYLEVIAKEIGTTAEHLLGEPETKKAPAEASADLSLESLLEMYRTRPECRMLFSLANDATPEDVRRAAAIIEALRKESSEVE